MRIYLGGYLDFYNPEGGNWIEVEVKQATPLTELLLQLGIPLGEIHMVVLNGTAVELGTTIVSDQDEIKLFSAVGGG
jgi:sulfur carrier protein ThiS